MAAGKKKDDGPKRGPKDEETGVAPAATDGVPNDPLTQEEREAAAEFDRDGAGAGGSVTHLPDRTNGNGNGGSSKDRAAAAGEEEDDTETEDDGQMALVVGSEGGREVTLGNLVRRNTPITLGFKMTGKAAPGIGGMLGFANPDVTLLVPARAGAVVTDPTYGTDESGAEVVKSVKLTQELRPKQVLNAQTKEARAMLLGWGDPLKQLVEAGRADGTSDADIRASIITELDVALAKRAA